VASTYIDNPALGITAFGPHMRDSQILLRRPLPFIIYVFFGVVVSLRTGLVVGLPVWVVEVGIQNTRRMHPSRATHDLARLVGRRVHRQGILELENMPRDGLVLLRVWRPLAIRSTEQKSNETPEVHQGVALWHLHNAVDALKRLARDTALYVLEAKGEMLGEGCRWRKSL
jgi:hypothetical protein